MGNGSRMGVSECIDVSRCTSWSVAMVLDDVRSVVGTTLQIRNRVESMEEFSPLLGAVPELDSIAVVNLINALEEHFGITVADDEIDAATFETLGSLTQFIGRKLSG